ncbi:hypothetical protein SEA_TROOPER_32 [Mycobacterium phage Trooper]|nr:hypothetical protein SEA_TROOPER_32 [Mycobacterium phage Trooper]
MQRSPLSRSFLILVGGIFCVSVNGRGPRWEVAVKRIARMTSREREHLLRELEIEHRVVICDATKIKRQMRDLAQQLEAKERRVREIEDGIDVLRGV